MSRLSKAEHAIITERCIDNKGDKQAFKEAVERLEKEYEECRKAHKESDSEKEISYHLKLEVEYE